MTDRLIESIAGMVAMTNGTHRVAYRNTYKVTQFSADGTSAQMVSVVRVEFELFTNANASSRKFRKATQKQADSFTAD